MTSSVASKGEKSTNVFLNTVASGTQERNLQCRKADVADLMMIARKLGIPQLFIDTNCINARGRLANMNLLERWHADGVISIRIPWDAQLEAEAGSNRKRQKKAWSYISPLPSITTEEERERLSRIEKLLFGEIALSDSQRRDALIVFTAYKYSAILVTADGASRSQPRGILGAAKELHQRIHIQVMTDEQAVAMVRMSITGRDKMARADALREAVAEPEWVGNDSR
jgi:hypothetical protein